jgi:hypothetical protein
MIPFVPYAAFVAGLSSLRASTSPSIDFSFAVSGMMIPAGVLSSARCVGQNAIV